MIDPHLSALPWLKRKFGSNILIGRMGDTDLFLGIIEALKEGRTFLVENVLETIDSDVMSVISRSMIHKGSRRYIMYNEEEIEVHQRFRLILHTKLSAPQYDVKIQVHTTVVNFSVASDGLENLLLGLVIKFERCVTVLMTSFFSICSFCGRLYFVTVILNFKVYHIL